MSRRTGPAALMALGLLMAALLLPIAAADHAYSHRYLVFGRVVDANGDPVQGVTVNLGYEPPFRPDGACSPQPNTETEAWGRTETRPVTNASGEFIFCFHIHSMSRSLPGTGILTVQNTDVTHRFDFDPFTRHSFEIVQLPEVSPNANPSALATTHTIQGTAWRPADGETFVESVRVFGHTIDQEQVNITFEYNGRAPVNYTTVTNNYGDFALRVPVEEKPTSGTVTIEIGGETFTEPVGEYGATVFEATFPEKSDPFVGKLLIGLGVVVGIAVVGGGAYVLSTRMRASREERVARERSTRKRSNK